VEDDEEGADCWDSEPEPSFGQGWSRWVPPPVPESSRGVGAGVVVVVVGVVDSGAEEDDAPEAMEAPPMVRASAARPPAMAVRVLCGFMVCSF
jgi:hypothetical protein